MATALTFTAPAGPVQAVGNGTPPVALQDKLAKCVRKLGDWQACPSGKTPEGKQIIKDLQTQIRNIESRIASAAQTTPGKATANSPSPATAPSATASTAAGIGAAARLLDVFA